MNWVRYSMNKIKKYDKLLSFGCSFTEGGGLNSPIYHNYLRGINTTDSLQITPMMETYMRDNAYPMFLAKLLDCNCFNYGVSRGSNELILKNLYEHTKDIKDGGNILITIQTSILSRIMLYSVDDLQFITINGLTPDLSKHVFEYYELYIKYFFEVNKEYEKLLQNINVYSEYLKNKNIDFVWILGDAGSNTLQESKYIISFEGSDLMSLGSTEKLRLCDLPNYPENDAHFSVDGNKIIANKILEHLEKYYGY